MYTAVCVCVCGGGGGGGGGGDLKLHVSRHVGSIYQIAVLV